MNMGKGIRGVGMGKSNQGIQDSNGNQTNVICGQIVDMKK